MDRTRTIGDFSGKLSWEEESGLIDFLKRVHGEVSRFDKEFELGVETLPSPPCLIDGSTDGLRDVGFVVVRRNGLLTRREYCLYALLRERVLYGYVGTYSEGAIETVRELKPMKAFKTGTAMLYDWLRELVKASCDKI
ncbi:MAG: hypothetical protein P8Z71_11225 [Candidatus Sulfobium sp.]